MTCIVGYTNGKNVWMGGDSAGTAGNMNQRIRADKKVFIRGEFLIGFCGSFRMGDLLKHTLEIPATSGVTDPDAFMVNDFVDSLRNCLEAENKKAGLTGNDKLYPSILVGFRGRLYNIEGDYQCGRPEDGYDSVGSGSNVAMGAMHASRSEKTPSKRITAALEAAARNDAAVRPPFHILKL
jgi:ATP-dependent protease HslVU (ClpYQ) peptidase subunit